MSDDEQHVHHFPVRIGRIGGWEVIDGYDPCECGVTRCQWIMSTMRDPVRLAMIAGARYRATGGFAAWRGAKRTDRGRDT